MNKSLLDLENIVIGSARGRKPSPFTAMVVRELNESDLAIAAAPPDYETQANPLVKLRHTHHMLARLLAEGRAPGECGLITGYSPSRISVLQNDPAFKELVNYYQGQAQEVFLNVHERLAGLGMAAMDELQERLENDPDKLSDGFLLDLGTKMLDRTVTKPNTPAGPQGGPQALNLQVTFVQANHAEGGALAPKLGGKVGQVIDGARADEDTSGG